MSKFTMSGLASYVIIFISVHALLYLLVELCEGGECENQGSEKLSRNKPARKLPRSVLFKPLFYCVTLCYVRRQVTNIGMEE